MRGSLVWGGSPASHAVLTKPGSPLTDSMIERTLVVQSSLRLLRNDDSKKIFFRLLRSRSESFEDYLGYRYCIVVLDDDECGTGMLFEFLN